MATKSRWEWLASAVIRGMARVRFEYDDRHLRQEVGKIMDKIDRNVQMTVEYNAARGTAYMKNNAPWNDDTTAARNGLAAVASHSGSKHEILFSHAVPYGIWLEIANSGKYQIIMPSVRATGDQLMSDLRGLLGRMR